MKQHFKDLLVWQKAMALVTEVYRLTRNFPKEELYGLTCQMRRAAVSIPSNIAEGQGPLTRGEFVHFLGQARGSLCELDTQMRLAKALGYLPEVEPPYEQSAEVGRLLNGLINSLRSEN
jgi:four helix bundle protein